MAKKKSSRTKTPLNRNITILVTGGVVVLATIYAFTGSDYLGLFTGEEGSAPPVPAEIVSGGGEWWTVHFTDPARINDPENLSGSIPAELIALIDDAEQSIHIAAFEFNLTPVAEALAAAHRRGVEVRWMTDDEHGIDADEEEGHGQFAMLEDAGIEIQGDGRSALMHNKFIIFDRQTVWTGSTNITENGNFRNNNNVIVIRSTRVAEMFEREFSEMWDDGSHGPKSPSTADLQSATVNGTPVQVFFAAEDEVIGRLLPWVENAQNNIKFMAFSFTHDDLGAAMLARAEAGVEVAGIFETRSSETEYSEMPRLYCAGVPVRQDGNPGTFHHKVIILDDEVVITGSLNFSENADNSNDENVVVIISKEIAGLYLAEFERRWAEAEEPVAADMGCK
jgi:phosphatidylserine/phosphatidylglycerophosphate/cardiolipin synthase-like enzyme